jgi:hypothetical protein
MYTKLKKSLSLGMLVLGLAALVSSQSYAVFTSMQRSTNTATATTSGTGLIAMTVGIRVTATAATDTAIRWTGVTLPATWVMSSNYIQLDSTLTLSGAAIQMYTDNRATDASPRYGGTPSIQDGAGLIDTSTNTIVLPMAWSIKDGTGPAVNVDPIAQNPQALTVPSYQWLNFKDRSTVAIPTQNITVFTDGEDWVTVKKGGQAQYFQATWFPTLSTRNYIFFEANFAAAQTPKTYQTTTLRLESYTP